jgi:hypothetical protein
LASEAPVSEDYYSTTPTTPLEAGEQVIESFGPDRATYWRDHAWLAAAAMALGMVILWVMGNPHVWTGAIGGLAGRRQVPGPRHRRYRRQGLRTRRTAQGKLPHRRAGRGGGRRDHDGHPARHDCRRIDTPEVLEFVTPPRAIEAAPVRIAPMAALTKGRQGREMTEIGFLKDAGAVAFTDCDRW